MKIALIGYGKMGRTIEQVALERGHEIVLAISSGNSAEMTPENLQKADCVIEFTRPDAAFENVSACLRAGVPVVCGTTAWLAQLPEAMKICEELNGSFLYASNFSIGVNLFFELNQHLAKLMSKHPEYKASIHEVHHTAKLDAPSGTAITLAQGLLDNQSYYKTWVHGTLPAEDQLPITHERTDPAPGTHTVSWQSEIDSIEMTHTAHSRLGFATGAVIAAEWLANKKGIFEMRDVLFGEE